MGKEVEVLRTMSGEIEKWIKEVGEGGRMQLCMCTWLTYLYFR